MVNEAIKKWYELNTSYVNALSDDIWEHPEVGMDSPYAGKATADFLERYGFEVQLLDGAMKGNPPNTVVAKFGSGKPVIGIVGEFDALPGLGNDCTPYFSPREGAGHGCGHNLMAAGCAAAAAALKDAMVAENIPGTLVYYGCPAEETFEGKVHMIHNNLFEGCDAALCWHPMQGAPDIVEMRLNAVYNIIIEYKGKTAHAGGEPEKGRSALDAAELTNVAVQYLREHVTRDVTMHHIYLSAGQAPNIVPDYAALNYFLRASDMQTCRELYERVKKCAMGAAMATETEVSFQIKAASYDNLINHTLNKVLYEAALKVPEVEYTDEEREFAREIVKNVTGEEPKIEPLETKVKAPTGVERTVGGSSDVGDLSYNLPTTQFWAYVRINGAPGHHWNTTALCKHSIGHKGQIAGGQVMAQAGYDLFKDPSKVGDAWAEFNKSMEGRPPYHCWMDDVE